MVEETNNEIGVMDDNGQDIKASLLATHRTELEQAQKSVTDTEKLLARFEEQIVNIEAIWKIQLNPETFKKVTPTMKYEEDPEFWKLQLQEQIWKVDNERAQYDGKKEHFRVQIENSKLRVEDLTEKIAKLEAE